MFLPFRLSIFPLYAKCLYVRHLKAQFVSCLNHADRVAANEVLFVSLPGIINIDLDPILELNSFAGPPEISYIVRDVRESPDVDRAMIPAPTIRIFILFTP